MEWNEDTVVNLIELYHSHPELWNTKISNYKNQNMKKESIREIGEALNVQTEEIVRKLAVILAQYRKARAKALKLKKSGMRKDRIQQELWFGYKHLSFLSEANCEGIEARKSQLPSEEQEYEEDESVEEENYSNYVLSSPAPTSSRLPTRRCSKRPQEFQDIKEVAQDYVILEDTSKNDDDECDLYVKLLAKKLRKIPEFERDQVMFEIDEVFLKANKRLQSQLP